MPGLPGGVQRRWGRQPTDGVLGALSPRRGRGKRSVRKDTASAELVDQGQYVSVRTLESRMSSRLPPERPEVEATAPPPPGMSAGGG